ncbi:YhcN/YlaJ family sporulation lipoprotein [Paenibacillus alvei]|uniref:YhcN/YlaJ family sporulation lipoprotein n=1 Tax=Paenibacillus alvei TaxID=44250 RepID=A0ABT4GUD1_PAEAL|nr:MULTISPECIES: YhcN/YlaJ family sporulation lipoprotein [Paenibacillus]EJW17395.1 putative lipoprotein YlaJ [Paenibacillus alvei DSM 29]MCY7487011.1 YhcN/YlaJ family sporulation lipoprotein [Paenibacillus alvei]MCY9540155.1 YhcN/YlaJ family sporulation lipoprotein [Paenibacillus alvei]MCY9705637.1 YhcN/YlaJ family sporulation lipoprotein [Paenibacillus alvei]MCY9734871.1 YhcN/YlaJ family sporulation lipoprotein [Paenibacillus alvei]
MRLLLIAMLVIGLISGCGNANKHAAANNPSNQVKAKSTPNGKPAIHDRAAVREHLTSLAKKVPGVRGVNCVVFGNTAIVGIDVDANLERSRVGTVKYSVAEVLSKDKYGAHALVTADVDLNQRLHEMAADIQQGHPISGFTEELADIMGRIVPQTPSDVRHIEPSRNTDQPKMKKHM